MAGLTGFFVAFSLVRGALEGKFFLSNSSAAVFLLRDSGCPVDKIGRSGSGRKEANGACSAAARVVSSFRSLAVAVLGVHDCASFEVEAPFSQAIFACMHSSRYGRNDLKCNVCKTSSGNQRKLWAGSRVLFGNALSDWQSALITPQAPNLCNERNEHQFQPA